MPENLFNKEIKLKMGIFIALVGALIISTGIIGYLISRDDSEIIVTKSGNDGTKDYNASSSPQVTQAIDQKEIVEEIKVYIVGEVNKPGVVNLRKGQIIEDAIKAAGGSTVKADLDNINLAYKLQENVMLKILPKLEPTLIKGEIKKEHTNIASIAPTPTKSINPGFAGVEIKSDSGGAILNENTEKGVSNGKVNINSATEVELETLPGVGPSTASKIVTFRQKSGNFKKIEDIMNVPGIGEGKFEDMKEFISID